MMFNRSIKSKKFTLKIIMNYIIFTTILLLITGVAILFYQKFGFTGIHLNHPLDFGHSVNNKIQ